jgi:glutamyl/glutaminyl-tRNA synthetase
VTWSAFQRTLHSESVLRIAPTPSGYLHPGNAVNALLVQASALESTPPARILLRIDDLDAQRKRMAYVQDVFDTLHWLGIAWDIGPTDAEDLEQDWSQHRRMPHYLDTLDALRATGMLYACRLSRKALEPFGPLYPRHLRDQGLSLDDPDVNWRIRTPEHLLPTDFVVRRRDGLPAYHVASLTDDHLFGVTHLVRGADLQASTQAQRFLAEVLGWSNFLRVPVWHHALLTDNQGNKLSKSTGAQAQPLSRSGWQPQALRTMALACREG